MNRRYFFFGSVLAGAVPAAGFGSVPSLRALGYKPYYDKLNVAAIGCGGQGGVILNNAAQTENIVALCDVDDNRAAANFQKFSKAPKYKDFRVMLDKEGKNIDACTIGIPDHMHATVALNAMQRGKHVYVEKPGSQNPREAEWIVSAAKKHGRVVQMGNQRRTSMKDAIAALHAGAIGTVRYGRAFYYNTRGAVPAKNRSAPAGIDLDLWQGPVPDDPRHSPADLAHYDWHWFWHWGNGELGNNGVHYLDITGEIAVFEACRARHQAAQQAGIVLMPGVGFDVVPTDCLAAMLLRA